jgi:CelD/BcsL family acetyltransferase involved in cellulose biosynthesis
MSTPGSRARGAEVEWVTEEERFLGLRDAWDRLARRVGFPFLRHAWFAAWWTAFGKPGRLRICTVWARGELAAVFPMFEPTRRVLLALANEHTPVFAPLACDDDSLDLLLSAVFARSPRSLTVESLPVLSGASRALEDASRHLARLTCRGRCYTSPVADLRGDFAAYRRVMSKRSRKDIERRRRKLEAEHDPTFELLVEPTALDAELAAVFAVEASGWKGRRGTAVDDRPETARFYRLVARAFAAEGAFRLSRISVGGWPIVFDYCLLGDNRLWSLKTGYDEDFRAYGPGVVLTLAEVERCFELGIGGLELLGDIDRSKLLFANAQRRHCAVHSDLLHPASVGRHVYWCWARPQLRRAYRRLHEHSDPRARRRQ